MCDPPNLMKSKNTKLDNLILLFETTVNICCYCYSLLFNFNRFILILLIVLSKYFKLFLVFIFKIKLSNII